MGYQIRELILSFLFNQHNKNTHTKNPFKNIQANKPVIQIMFNIQ